MYGMSYGKKKKMQKGSKVGLAKMYGDPNKITRGDIIAAATKNEKQMGSMVMKPMGKAKDTQAPQSYMEDQNRQKTMMYGGMAAKKERKPMNLGGTVKYFGNAYGPRKPKTVLS